MLDMSLWLLAEIARARSRYWDEVADMWAARNQPARAAHERRHATRYRALARRAEALEESLLEHLDLKQAQLAVSDDEEVQKPSLNHPSPPLEVDRLTRLTRFSPTLSLPICILLILF